MFTNVYKNSKISSNANAKNNLKLINKVVSAEGNAKKRNERKKSRKNLEN